MNEEEKKKKWIPIAIFIVIMLLGAIAINININLGDFFKDKETEAKANESKIVDENNNKPLSVDIISPTGEAKAQAMVKGTVSRSLKDSEHMWLVVNPLKAYIHLWPQNGGPIVPKNDLTWKGVAYLGGEPGDEFEIHVIVVDEALNSKISDWVQECIKADDWPPITEKGLTKAELMRHALDTVEVKLEA
jgi:hypothetical protein